MIRCWQVTRRRVSLAGCVVSGHTSQLVEKPANRVIAGALIRLSREGLPEQVTESASDGVFHFLKLREGRWQMSVTLPSRGLRYSEVHREVVIDDSAEQVLFLTVPLQPFVIQGRVSEKGQNGLCMAEVRVKGSGEKCLSNRSGRYEIVGVEPVPPRHTRLVQVSARGFELLERPAEMDSSGSAYQQLDFELERKTSSPPATKKVRN